MALARVILIEDDLFTRSTLSALLTHRGFEVVGQTESVEEALMIQGLYSPEVALVDLDLGPGPNGIDVATALRKVNPNIGVVMLTTFMDPRFTGTNNLPLPKGARFLTKNELSDVSTLVVSILQVLRNPLSHAKQPKGSGSSLTEGQIEILKLVSEGHTTSSIALTRGVSEKSIEATLSRIHSSLGLPKTKQLNPRVQLTRAFFSLTGKKPPGE
jgi:DNA-binding NarL/FixJ family response regulator